MARDGTPVVQCGWLLDMMGVVRLKVFYIVTDGISWEQSRNGVCFDAMTGYGVAYGLNSKTEPVRCGWPLEMIVTPAKNLLHSYRWNKLGTIREMGLVLWEYPWKRQ